MSRTCYRDGGCGPYEDLSCTECPASWPDYREPDPVPPKVEEFGRKLLALADSAPGNAPISLDEYRRDAMRTYPYELARNERRDYAAMKLSEEAAEVMALVNKSQYQGEPYSRERIRDELGDVWWALNVNLVEHGLTLDEIMLANVAKRRVRYPGGV